MSLPRVIVVVLVMLGCQAVAAAEGYRATYKLAAGPVTVGRMERTFSLDASGRYEFVSTIRTVGLAALVRRDELTEMSTGQVKDGKFFPETYSYERENKRKPRSERTQFDRAGSEIKTLYNGEERNAPLPAGILDKLVYQAALMFDLAAGESTFSYTVTDRGRQKTYTPELGPRESLDTPLGTLETVQVIRRNEDDPRRTIFWCAPALDYLPVKVAYREKDGDETIITLTEYTPH